MATPVSCRLVPFAERYGYMNEVTVRPTYPESVYCTIFGKIVYPEMPPDAEETIEYIMGTLYPQEADMFMFRYRDEMIYEEIGEKCGLSKERVRKIIDRVERKLRQPARSNILLTGRKA